jgi:hypothetical protein
MEIHILNGDTLAQKFNLDGKIIVCRECLIDGPVKAEDLDNFWNMRATYLSGSHKDNQQFYINKVKSELQTLLNLPENDSVNLWFEHDLFCQVNMWFVTHLLLKNPPRKIFRVMPLPQPNVWRGFGMIDTNGISSCFEQRVLLSAQELQLAATLWKAFKDNDFRSLLELSKQTPRSFPYLKEICEAHIERFKENNSGRPQSRLKQILKSGKTDFPSIFQEFNKTEGIYGFGDLQVQAMLESLA